MQKRKEAEAKKAQNHKLAKTIIESHGLDNDKKLPDFTNWMLIGREMTKIMFWTQRYNFSFQFWGVDNNNVYIERDGVDIADFGGEATPMEIMQRTVKWCEEHSPGMKYPKGIEISNPQP